MNAFIVAMDRHAILCKLMRLDVTIQEMRQAVEVPRALQYTYLACELSLWLITTLLCASFAEVLHYSRPIKYDNDLRSTDNTCGNYFGRRE